MRQSPETGAESWRWVLTFTALIVLLVGALCIYAFRPEGKFQAPRQQIPSVSGQ